MVKELQEQLAMSRADAKRANDANAELNATAESATASTSLKFVAVGDWVRSVAAAHTSHAHTPPLTLLNQPHTHAGRPT